jgi:hypothetical protein
MAGGGEPREPQLSTPALARKLGFGFALTPAYGMHGIDGIR